MKLTIAPNRRWLVDEQGKPFFYLADTGWELFHRLTFDEACHYLKTRAAQGFNVIQAVVLSEFCGTEGNPVPNGLPLIDGDPLKPNEQFFAHVDRVIAQASAEGLIMNLNIAWGNYWMDPAGVDRSIFTPGNAHVYGEYVGRRYRDANVMWFLGGDRVVTQPRQWEVIRAMAAGLRAGDGGAHLISFHPSAEQSPAIIFAQDDWLDFSMIQTGHGIPPMDNAVRMMEEYGRIPTRPVLDGEPCYEDHPIMRRPPGKDRGWEPIGDVRFTGGHVRREAWWALFAGACGHAYGCHSVWQMHKPEYKPVTRVRYTWDEALDLPGARQMRHLKAFFEALPVLEMVPDLNLLTETMGPRGEEVLAMRNTSSTLAVFYFPTGKPFLIDVRRLAAEQVNGTWYDPRTGECSAAGEWETTWPVEVVPPTRGEDWALVVRGSDT